MLKEIFALLAIQFLLVFVHTQCHHKIFCNPDILLAAANSNLFNDSKTFVDLVLTVSVEQALINFQKQTPQQFFKYNFHPDPQIILSPVEFPDYQNNPQLLNKIQDPQLKQFASELNKRWNLLGKKVNLSAAASVGTCRVDCSSYLPEIDKFNMLVPGGRFRQSYYWDTYWIVLGLIATDMLDTAEMIINNFASIIQWYGYVPNGLRQYYLTRSQPPFLFLMVKDLTSAFRAKGNAERARKLQMQLFKYLNKQHDYWSATHKLSAFIDGTYYQLNQYRANTKNPRPESFRQDMQTVKNILSTQQKIRVWKGLSSMAQSGWDFSSRWLKNIQLSSTQIDHIIPSDLIALLGMMEKYLAELSLNFFYPALFQKYTMKYTQKISYFKSIKRDGRYPDFRLDGNQQISYVYPSDYMPFIFLQEKTDLSQIYKQVLNPQASNFTTGQQWDSPNVWTPNNWIIHQVTSGQQPKKYATQWILTTYCSYKKHNAIFQKYDGRSLGQRGQGGQYQPQIGFGWTNGLALHYLSLYPQTKVNEC